MVRCSGEGCYEDGEMQALEKVGSGYRCPGGEEEEEEEEEKEEKEEKKKKKKKKAFFCMILSH
jgi:hypothetical protein